MDLKTIYEEHKSLVYNLALQYTQNVQEAEEVTQDVFISVYNKLHEFQNRSSLKTWIYRITVNKSLDYIKARKRKKRSGFLNMLSISNHEDAVDIGHFDHPGVALEDKEALSHVFSCINKLPEKQKTVILMLKIEQLSQAETAEIMETTVKAVESLFQRAKKKLQILLDENEG